MPKALGTQISPRCIHKLPKQFKLGYRDQELNEEGVNQKVVWSAGSVKSLIRIVSKFYPARQELILHRRPSSGILQLEGESLPLWATRMISEYSSRKTWQRNLILMSPMKSHSSWNGFSQTPSPGRFTLSHRVLPCFSRRLHSDAESR
jgi:hypothetical protein